MLTNGFLFLLQQDTGEPGWWRGETGGKEGVFPDNFVVMLSEGEKEVRFHFNEFMIYLFFYLCDWRHCFQALHSILMNLTFTDGVISLWMSFLCEN